MFIAPPHQLGGFPADQTVTQVSRFKTERLADVLEGKQIRVIGIEEPLFGFFE
jgi:hypothetical protein